MARLNTAPPRPRTHEGASAKRLTGEQRLRRAVLACMLWEREFYEDGREIADRILEEVRAVDPAVVRDLAIEARTAFKLRHVPLLLVSALVRVHRREAHADTVLPHVIRRADELGEFVAVHAWMNGVQPAEVKPVLGAQVKRGLAEAFRSFDRYQFAKYDRKNAAVRLRDVMRLVHPKPKDAHQSATWAMLRDNNLLPPDTWESNLTAGADKRETFERLLRGGKLGYLALLRNLRNMEQAGVDRALVQRAILERKGADSVLPFRYVAAARAAPQFEPQIDKALRASLEGQDALPGRTLVLVDHSASMDMARVSARSDLTRFDAAATLASIIPADDLRVFAFSQDVAEVPHRPGMAGIEAIARSMRSGGTWLGRALQTVMAHPHDRLIVVTDEQSHDRVPDPVVERSYMVNVASNRNGVGYGRWRHIDGFSESIVRYIAEVEREGL